MQHLLPIEISAPQLPLVLPGSDLVGSLPGRLARRFAEHHGIVLLDLPYQPAKIAVEIIWHERAARDPALLWLVAQVEAALTT